MHVFIFSLVCVTPLGFETTTTNEILSKDNSAHEESPFRGRSAPRRRHRVTATHPVNDQHRRVLRRRRGLRDTVSHRCRRRRRRVRRTS